MLTRKSSFSARISIRVFEYHPPCYTSSRQIQTISSGKSVFLLHNKYFSNSAGINSTNTNGLHAINNNLKKKTIMIRQLSNIRIPKIKILCHFHVIDNHVIFETISQRLQLKNIVLRDKSN